MFQKYKELIQSIFNGIVNGESTATVKDYFQIVGCTLAIIAIVLFMIVLFWGAYQLPKYIYKKTTKDTCDQINAILDKSKQEFREILPEEEDKLNKLNRKMNKIKASNIIGVCCVYIPIMIPLVLILMDCIISIF